MLHLFPNFSRSIMKKCIIVKQTTQSKLKITGLFYDVFEVFRIEGRGFRLLALQLFKIKHIIAKKFDIV